MALMLPDVVLMALADVALIVLVTDAGRVVLANMALVAILLDPEPFAPGLPPPLTPPHKGEGDQLRLAIYPAHNRNQ